MKPISPGRGLNIIAALVLGMTVARPAIADQAEIFNHDYALAWPHYRDAWVQSADGDGPATVAALGAFTTAWGRLTDDFAAGPPPTCRDDAQCGDDLRLIGGIAARAATQARRGGIDQAHRTLAEIRAILGEMRRRNGIAAYDDQMDAFEDKLAEAGDDDFDQAALTPEQFIHLIEQLGVLAYLTERLEKLVPAQWAGDPLFLDMAEGLARQVVTVKATAFTGQPVAVKAALADLRRNFDKFYLFFG